MANTVSNTLNKVGDAIEGILGKQAPKEQPMGNGNGNQSCLEKFAIEARKHHILRNEWRKDLEYSKPLVNAEYLIQTEFKIR